MDSWNAHAEEFFKNASVPSPKADDQQVGGDHYLKRRITPWDIWAAYPEMDPFTASIIKYMLRWPDKNGIIDLKKARHTLDKLIELEEGGRASDQLG